MAVTSLSLLLLAQKYRGNLIRQANRKAATFQFLGIDEDKGPNCAWGFKTDGQLARAILEGADTTVFGADAQFPAILDWGIYEFPLALTNLALDAAASNEGAPDDNEDAWADQLQDGFETMSSLLNRDIYVGDGLTSGTARKITGFWEIFGQTTNTYAGRDRSQVANALLRPNVFGSAASPVPFTVKTMRDDLSRIYIASGERPDLAFAHSNVFNMIGERFDNVRRLEQYVDTASGRVILDGSVSAIQVNGCTVIEDKDAYYSTDDTAASGSITYVNSRYTRMKILPPSSVYNRLVKAQEQYRINDGRDNLMLNIRLEMLNKTGASNKARGETTLQLQCKRPNSGGIRQGIEIAVAA